MGTVPIAHLLGRGRAGDRGLGGRSISLLTWSMGTVPIGQRVRACHPPVRPFLIAFFSSDGQAVTDGTGLQKWERFPLTISETPEAVKYRVQPNPMARLNHATRKIRVAGAFDLSLSSVQQRVGHTGVSSDLAPSCSCRRGRCGESPPLWRRWMRCPRCHSTATPERLGRTGRGSRRLRCRKNSGTAATGAPVRCRAGCNRPRTWSS